MTFPWPRSPEELGPDWVDPRPPAVTIDLSWERSQHLFLDYADMAHKLSTYHLPRSGMTIEEVANKAGVGARFVWDVLHGQPRTEAWLLARVLKALSVDFTVLRVEPYGPWAENLADPMSSEIPGKFELVKPPGWDDPLPPYVITSIDQLSTRKVGFDSGE